jgi:putative membrane protein
VMSVRRLARRGRSWSPWRTASFLGGTLMVVIAVQSGLASYDDSVFAVHVVQHLLLMNVAPILLALSAPVTLALQASERRTQQGLLKVLHHRAVEFVTNPVFVVLVAYGTMIGYFLTPLYNLSLEHPLLHNLSHLHFLVSGCLFWWLVVGRDPSRWRLTHPVKLGILAIGIPVTAVLGISLTGARASVAPLFHTVADTHRGGSILWVVGEVTTVVAMAIIVYQWIQYEERQAVRADRQLDSQAQT